MLNKSVLLFFFGFLLSCTRDATISSDQANYFVKFFGGSDVDKATDMVPCSDGGYALTGSLKTADNVSHAFFMKTDKYGNPTDYSPVLLTSNLASEGYRISATRDGGFLVVGYTVTDKSDRDLLLVKIAKEGSVDWSKTYGGTNNDEGFCALELSSGNIIAGGYTTNSFRAKDGWILMLDSNGSELWSNSFGGTGNDICNFILERDDYFLLVGSTESFQYSTLKQSVVLVKVTKNSGSAFDFVWYGGAANESGVKALSDQNNHLYILANSNDSDSSRLYLLKLNEDFHQVIWQKYFPASDNETGNDIVLRDNQEIIIGTSETKGNSDFLMDVLDSVGNIINPGSHIVQALGNQIGQAGVIGPDGRIVIAGVNIVQGYSKIALIKMDIP